MQSFIRKNVDIIAITLFLSVVTAIAAVVHHYTDFTWRQSADAGIAGVLLLGMVGALIHVVRQIYIQDFRKPRQRTARNTHTPQ